MQVKWTRYKKSLLQRPDIVGILSANGSAAKIFATASCRSRNTGPSDKEGVSMPYGVSYPNANAHHHGEVDDDGSDISAIYLDGLETGAPGSSHFDDKGPWAARKQKCCIWIWNSLVEYSA